MAKYLTLVRHDNGTYTVTFPELNLAVWGEPADETLRFLVPLAKQVLMAVEKVMQDRGERAHGADGLGRSSQQQR